MVPRMKIFKRHAGSGEGTSRRVPRHVAFDIAAGILVVAVFCLKITNYADPSVLRPTAIRQEVSLAINNTVSAVSNLPFLNSCAGGLRMIDVSGGFVCSPGSGSSPYATIYRSYPLVGQGREVIYSSSDQGTIKAADDLMRHQYDVPRFRPVRLPATPTWSENDYSAVYWRFEFYSLRPTLNLLYAFRTTGNAAYAKQLVHLDLSFIAAEPKSRWAWVDPHAVAFRGMSLIDTWWKLRQGHELSQAASTTILGELEKTGQFLADPNHYQIGENHGTNEAAALYNLAVAFPTLPHARQWLALAEQRFEWQLKGIVDADGQLIENSPYYDFYTLEKYWDIYNYMKAQHQALTLGFAAKLQSMLNFATYILQPNSQVPLLGASLEETINYHGVYAKMAAADSHFLYVLTHGLKGSAPPVQSKFFPASSLTVMRSGWKSGPTYPRSTYLTYNIGRYRTAHSDLDALGITLYGDGGDLLPDPGLDTYTSGPYHRYFHGTVSHNTVAVDGKSQFQGDGAATPLISKDGVTYQSAESSLYSGVQHRRVVMMLGADHLLIVDQLHSDSVHTYQQMFHLFPGARLSKSGLTVSGVGGTPRREVTIQQLQPAGIAESDVINQRGQHPAGLCSQQYGKLLPCHQISYSVHQSDATFETLITIGKPRADGFAVKVEDQGQRFQVTDGDRHLNIALGHSVAIAPTASATDPTPPKVRTLAVPASVTTGNWTAVGGGVLSSRRVKGGNPHFVTRLSSSTTTGPVVMRNDAVRLNLTQHNARLRLKVDGLPRVSELGLKLSNNHWANSITTNLRNSYTRDAGGGWTDIFVGRSPQWGPEGGWHAAGPGFNWAKVDGMEIELEVRRGRGTPPLVSTTGLRLLPVQKEGKVVFVFDDGYQSVLPAAAYLHREGMPGDIAVIGKYVDYPTQDYLNLFQLRALQNQWGWDMVNHTQAHVDAVQQYYDRHDLTGYANDILKQAAWLEASGLNSAPNWFIYPHGTTNNALERVVGRYYMFARGITDNPDAYPYGDPRQVNDLEIQYPGDGEGGDTGFTPPSQIISAARQAAKNHMTLILTFHRIHSQASDLPGYPLKLFKEVVDGVRDSGATVMTLSQLDRSNHVPVNNRIYVSSGQRSQITVQISD
jgi:hypothetical protein